MNELYEHFKRFVTLCTDFCAPFFNAEGNLLKPGPKPRFSDIHVIALALAAESLGYDSERNLFTTIQQCLYSSIGQFISRRCFNRRRKSLHHIMLKLRKNVANFLSQNTSHFCIDSMPIAVCRMARSSRCKMIDEDKTISPDHGYCASQKTYYFGYKLHSVCDKNGVIFDYKITPASFHNINYLKEYDRFKKGVSIIGGRGYISKQCQLDLFTHYNITLETPLRKNQHQTNELSPSYNKDRKRIEKVLSQLYDRIKSLEIRREFIMQDSEKITAMTMIQLNDFYEGKPIERLKASLFN